MDLWQLWLNLGCLFIILCQMHPEPEGVVTTSQSRTESSSVSLQLTLGYQAS